MVVSFMDTLTIDDIMTFAHKAAEDVGGEVVKVKKNNNTEHVGITRRAATSNIAPTVYIDTIYSKYRAGSISYTKAIDVIENALTSNTPGHDTSMTWFKDYTQVKPRLSVRLVNSKNISGVYISAANYGFKDLVLETIVKVNVNGHSGSIKVLPEHLKMWGVDIDTLLIDALKNIDAPIINNMGDMFDFIEPCNMIVITNKSGIYGATSILLALDKLRAMYPEGFIVIPSSVHELIVISKNMYNPVLKDIIQSVNNDVVEAEEVLSDHEYIF